MWGSRLKYSLEVRGWPCGLGQPSQVAGKAPGKGDVSAADATGPRQSK
jgi:hypothetical protein